MIIIGKFLKNYGLKGHIKAKFFLENIDQVLSFKNFFIKDGVEINLKFLKKIKEIFICKINEYNKKVQKCLDIIHVDLLRFVLGKKDDVKNELKGLMKPMIDLILEELYPYIFLSIVFVFISFFILFHFFLPLKGLLFP